MVQTALPPLVDSHCHLTWDSFGDEIDEVVARMVAAGVEAAVVVATDLASAEAGRTLAARHSCLHATAGLHPNDLPADLDESLAALGRDLDAHPYVAVGETGLDYYRGSERAADQQKAFREQCRFALARSLPIVVHIRDVDGSWQAYDDVAEIIGAHPGIRGVIHCYTGDAAHARTYLDLGFYVSFAGMLTFPKGENVREAARVVPLERVLVETDAPFLAPVPHRGRRNEPAYVVEVANALATLHARPRAEVYEATGANARALFGLAGAPSSRPPYVVHRPEERT